MIVITKDYDFRASYYLRNTPKKLIKINLGNIAYNELVEIFTDNISSIKKLDEKKSFIVEIDKDITTYVKEE